MTYDIMFLRVSPGYTFQETLDRINAAYDPDADPEPMNPTSEDRLAWERITHRVSGEIGPVAVEEFPYSLTMDRSGPRGHFLLDYSGDSATIAIPYRYADSLALPIMTEAYHVAHILEDESGLEGYDAEVGQPVRGGDIEKAAARLGGVTQWAQDNLS